MDVLRLRGFTYKTTIMWDKVVDGTGYWFRNRHEQMLVGTRGNVPAPAPGTQWPSVIAERKRGHSVKPEQSYQMIEQYFSKRTKDRAELSRQATSRMGCVGQRSRGGGRMRRSPSPAPGRRDLRPAVLEPAVHRHRRLLCRRHAGRSLHRRRQDRAGHPEHGPRCRRGAEPRLAAWHPH